MLLSEVTVEQAAAAIGIKPPAFYARLRGDIEFTVSDIEKLADEMKCEVVDLL